MFCFQKKECRGLFYILRRGLHCHRGNCCRVMFGRSFCAFFLLQIHHIFVYQKLEGYLTSNSDISPPPLTTHFLLQKLSSLVRTDFYLSDQSQIIGYPCHKLTKWLLLLTLYQCDSGCWRFQNHCCYSCWLLMLVLRKALTTDWSPLTSWQQLDNSSHCV